jgi:hypothetical protein
VRGARRVALPADPGDRLSGQIYLRLLEGNTMDTPATVIRREVLESIGCFDESMVNLEDWDLALRVGMRFSIAFLDEVTILSYVSSGGVNKRLAPESKVTILRKHYDAYRGLPTVMGPITWSIGKDYAMRGERDEAVHYMNISVALVPTAAKRLLRSAVFAGMNPYPVLYYALRIWWSRSARAAMGTLPQSPGSMTG